MTIIERKSERKKKAIMQLVSTGEYSIAYAMMLAEELNDAGKLLDNDYEELAEYLESLIVVENEVAEENSAESVENTAEETEENVESEE